MGAGRHLIIAATGFPATNETWRFIQQAWREPLEALARLCGDKVILSGVVVAGGNASDGYVSYGGEILEFVGGPTNANVTIMKETITAQYDVDIDNDGTQDTLPQYERYWMQFGNDGEISFPFSELSRLDTIKELSDFALPANLVIDANYVHTDNNLTTVMIEAWNALISNVRANWAQTNPQAQDYVLNKPTNLLTALRRSFVQLGNWPNSSDEETLITFPSVGTTNYFVLGTLVSQGNWDNDNEVFWSVREKGQSSFKLIGRQMAGGTTNLRFDYVLIPSLS